jgi:hypothetical protein
MENSTPFFSAGLIVALDGALSFTDPNVLTTLDSALHRVAASHRRPTALVALADVLLLTVQAWYGGSLTTAQATEIATREAAHLGLSLPLATSVMVAVWESRLAYGVDMHREHRAVARLVGRVL